MKQFALLLYVVAVATSHASACGVCGSSAGSPFIGTLPGVNRNFIGTQFQRYCFERNQPALFKNWPNERSANCYSTIQALGRYAVGEGVQLFAVVPYRYNKQTTDTTSYLTSGVGDITLSATVATVIRKKGSNQHQLLSGAGIKLPSGKWNGSSEMNKQGLPNLDPGTGSWDFIANGNYTLKRRAYIITSGIDYTITTSNKRLYKFGNKFNASLYLLRSVKIRNINAMPQIGFRYERALHDYDNYKRRWLNEQSGGYMSFACTGMQLQHNNLGLKITAYLPLIQRYSSGYITAKQRFDAIFFLTL